MSVVYASFGDAGAERACEVLGTCMAAGSALASIELIRDPAITPDDLTAGLIKAHMMGAAAAILGAENAGQLDRASADELAREAGRVCVEAIAAMRELR